jgi:hypothetical protein
MEDRRYDSTYSRDRPYIVMNGPENGGIIFLRNFGKNAYFIGEKPPKQNQY